MTWHTTHRRRLWWQIGVTVVIVVLGVTVLLVRTLRAPEGGPGSSPPVTTTSEVPTSSPAPQATGNPALAVKIDNVRSARPATGLGSADVVYVEPVEGGLTRLIAVYHGAPPPVIGPVRSSRRTDIELLGQYGKPVLVYSGAAPELLPALHTANLVNASPAQVPSAYYRDSSRPAPHNLYVRPQRLPTGVQPPAQPALEFGPAPVAGVTSHRHDIAFRAAAFCFTWSQKSGRWLVSVDGSPMASTDCGQLGAATVIEQRVAVSTAESTEDSLAGSHRLPAPWAAVKR